jgi:hypothetical protein
VSDAEMIFGPIQTHTSTAGMSESACITPNLSFHQISKYPAAEASKQPSKPAFDSQVLTLLASDRRVGLCVHQQGDNETIETCSTGVSGSRLQIQGNHIPVGDDRSELTQNFSENEDQDHSDVQPGLLRSAPDTGIANNADCKSGSQPRQAYGQASAKLNEACEEG